MKRDVSVLPVFKVPVSGYSSFKNISSNLPFFNFHTIRHKIPTLRFNLLSQGVSFEGGRMASKNTYDRQRLRDKTRLTFFFPLT